VSWCSARTERIFIEEIPAPPDQVRNFYVDLNNMKLVHPLVVAVRQTARQEEANGYVQSYRIVDRIPLGTLAIRTSYRVQLRVFTRGEVITEARQFPGVRLRATVTFEPIDGGTRVTERIRIAVPRPLAAFTIRQASNAHATMLSAIRCYFQSL
jgi:hypothetical protein